MPPDLEALLGCRCDEMVGDLPELRLRDREGVIAPRVALAQPRRQLPLLLSVRSRAHRLLLIVRPSVRTPPQDVDRSAPSRLKASLEDIIDQAGLAKGPAKKGGSRKSVGSRRASSTEEISATKIQAVERGRASRAA